MHNELLRIPSPQLGRPVHVWHHGHAGAVVLALPTAGGYAHEWQQQGMIEALSDWIDAGLVQICCPETNVRDVWTHPDAPLADRLAQHTAYVDFLHHTLVPHLQQRAGDVPRVQIGCSLGGYYAAHLALQRPKTFGQAIAVSGRFRMQPFLQGPDYDPADKATYLTDPLAYQPAMHGPHLALQQAHTDLTLVVGQGPHEGRCLPETQELGAHLARLGVPHTLDVWGRDAAHGWGWWRRMVRLHLARWLNAAAQAA